MCRDEIPGKLRLCVRRIHALFLCACDFSLRSLGLHVGRLHSSDKPDASFPIFRSHSLDRSCTMYCPGINMVQKKIHIHWLIGLFRKSYPTRTPMLSLERY